MHAQCSLISVGLPRAFLNLFEANEYGLKVGFLFDAHEYCFPTPFFSYSAWCEQMHAGVGL